MSMMRINNNNHNNNKRSITMMMVILSLLSTITRRTIRNVNAFVLVDQQGTTTTTTTTASCRRQRIVSRLISSRTCVVAAAGPTSATHFGSQSSPGGRIAFVTSLSSPSYHHLVVRQMSSTSTNDNEAAAAAAKGEGKKGQPRHDVSGGTAMQQPLPPKIQSLMEEYQEHQQNAPKLGWATDIRTLIQYNHGYAVISTNSKSDPDYPSGSVVGFAVDNAGYPIFCFSGMSTHTQDILVDPHCSLTIAAKDFKGAADGRVNIMGRCTLIKDSHQMNSAKEYYRMKHPNAFWVEFGDFNWFRMTVDKIRFVGGFARAGSVSSTEYHEAKPDPISEYGPDIAKHMNDDHMDATIAIVKKYIPGMMIMKKNEKSNDDDTDFELPEIKEAMITSIDSLGMYIKITRDGPIGYLPQQFKARLPFPRPAIDRKDVRTLIVEMTTQQEEEATASVK